MRLVVAIILAFAFTSTLLADEAITWKGLPGVDGKVHSLSDLSKSDVVVIVVTCNHCPIAFEYFERLKDFADMQAKAGGNVALVAVSVSHLETDKLPRMKALAERQGFNFPYLYDESQELGKSLGATHTPHFFVLGKDRSVVYRGPWDDNLNATKVKTRYVESAVDALLAGKEPKVTTAKPVGCPITYEKK